MWSQTSTKLLRIFYNDSKFAVLGGPSARRLFPTCHFKKSWRSLPKRGATRSESRPVFGIELRIHFV
jgi:hypothetical protein